MIAVILAATPTAADETVRLPVLVPITGFLALEGTSQMNGALLAIREAAAGPAPSSASGTGTGPALTIEAEVADTGVSPEVALTQLERALAQGRPPAIVAPMLGTQMLALIPRATEAKVPLVTVSGTAKITELGSAYVFRFFPGDAVVKAAQARYTVEELKAKRPALLYQTTAYGQSGRQHLADTFAKLGAPLVAEEAIQPTAKDLLPALTKALAAKPDVLVLQLHAPSMALAIRQARSLGVTLPIVAGSAMHQPSTAALLEPGELAHVCAESGSSPISGGSPQMEAFAAAYRDAFKAEPDAFALAQYDGTRMVLAAIAEVGADPERVRDWLASHSHDGIAMTYRSDGVGNMAHDAVIICYDGVSRRPTIVKRYQNPTG